jgi:predicted nucleic-acid-binding protein
MHVVDTDVLVRYVTDDDPQQSPVARRFIDTHEVRLTWGVLLECEWVLRSAHALSRERIVYIMRQFAGLPHVHVDDAESLSSVVACFEQGMDFADAMHLFSCKDEEVLATFDRKLKAAAEKIHASQVKLLRA